MIELTWVADALRVGGLLFVLIYYGAAALLIYKAARWKKPLWQKAAALAVVGITFGYLPVSGYLEQRERRAYAKAAWDRFNKYCAEKAGEKIYRRVTDVESVLVMRPRPDASETQFTDQQWRGDPYGFGLSDAAEIGSLLRPDRASANTPLLMGYTFAEVSIVDGSGLRQTKQYRVVKRDASDAAYNDLQTEVVNNQRSKFGFTWEDISTDEDRRFWIAGGVLRVVDLTTNEIIAERVGYLIDPLFGNRSSGRVPWLAAVSRSCPSRMQGELRITRRFLTQVLQPIIREGN